MSYVPVVLRCPFRVSFSGQDHNNKAAVEPYRLVLHSRNLSASVLSLGMWHEDMLLVGMKLASSSPLLILFPVLLSFLQHLQSQENAVGVLLAVCQSDVKQGKNIQERGRSVIDPSCAPQPPPQSGIESKVIFLSSLSTFPAPFLSCKAKPSFSCFFTSE